MIVCVCWQNKDIFKADNTQRLMEKPMERYIMEEEN